MLENHPKDRLKDYKSPGIICSCIAESLEVVTGTRTYSSERQAVIVSRIEAEEISFETKGWFDKERIYRLNFSPVGGTPFTAQARVLDISESYRRGFYSVAAKFEELTPRQHQSLLSLMENIKVAGIRNPMLGL